MESEVIILAAGASQRMGKPKGLLDFFGKPWLSEQIQRLQKIGFKNITVVTGAHHERYVKEIGELKNKSVHVVFNEKWVLGPFSSIVKGIQNHNVHGYFIQPVDVPVSTSMSWNSLITGDFLATIPLYQGRGGHPVFLSAEFANHLKQIPVGSPDARLDIQLRQNSKQIHRVSVDSNLILENFNTPLEWQYFSNLNKKS